MPEHVDIFILEHKESISKNRLLLLGHWSTSEIETIERYVDARARTSWCLSRIFAKKILAGYLAKEWTSISFYNGEFGKPFIPVSEICFNWSHTPGCILLGVSRNREIGVDIERFLNATVRFREIASSFFSQSEYEWVISGTHQEERERFLSLFVQKEAYLKMKGCGLSTALSEAPAELKTPEYQTCHTILFNTGNTHRCIACAHVDSFHEEQSAPVEFKLHLPSLDLRTGKITM